MKKFFHLTLLTLLIFISCEEKIKPSIVDKKLSESYPSQESWNSKIILTREGKILAIIEVAHLQIFEDRKLTLLDDGVKVYFYNEEEKNNTTLTSRKGKVDDVTKDLEAYGNVVVISDDGTVLRTEKLFWKNATQKITTDAYVEIDSPKEKIRGNGLESDQNLKNYKILNVTGQTSEVK